MKRIATLLVLVALCASGCTSSGYVHVDTFDGLIGPVADRHDAYVQADKTLDETQKRVFLRSTELLRKIIDEAKKAAEQ